MGAIDQDGSGLIHYTEFLAACLFVSPEETIEFEMDVDTVFDKLDTDRDGLISESNLREILGPMCTRSYVTEILGTSNDDSNGKSDEPKIDRKQFKRLIGLVKDACKSVSTPELPDTEEEEKEDSA